jgi:hypothetical protein
MITDIRFYGIGVSKAMAALAIGGFGYMNSAFLI